MGTAILYPVFAQMGLTFLLLVLASWKRRQALVSRATTFAEIALDDRRWPEDARKVSNCYRNQLELPVIFYVLCLVALITGLATPVTVALAWGFVLSRLGHAYVHTTSNRVPVRGAVFGIGFLIVVAMTALLAGQLLLRDL